jgi:hypothetical protein
MIGVSISNDLLEFHRSPPSYKLRGDVLYWLLDHIGSGSAFTGYSPGCSWLWTVDSHNPQKAIVVFDDYDVAMLFKLTWGGI